jgi:dolichol kinase
MVGNIDWHEIRRKVFHILGGVALALLIYFDILSAWMVLLLVGVGAILSIVSTFYDIPVIYKFLDQFEREHLRRKFPGKGVLYLFLGILFMMLLFEKNIVLAGLMIWTFGDSFAALIGKHYGRNPMPTNVLKTIEGTIAGIIAGGLAACMFVSWYLAFAGAVVSIIIESFDWKIYKDNFDDNFFVPVVGAFVIYLLTLMF